MKYKIPLIVIMWVIYGTLEEYFYLLQTDFFSMILAIFTILIIFDIYPKSIFSKSGRLEKKILKKFKHTSTLEVNDHLHLVQTNSKFEDILVFYNKEKICNLKEFEEKYPGKYEKLLESLLSAQPQVKIVKEEPEVKQSDLLFEPLIQAIDSYNIDIPDEDISLGLYNCTNQLKYLQKLLIDYPQENDKINKLKQYYLPILLDILDNYCKVSKTDDATKIKNKLNQTLVLVNEAIQNITQTLFDEEKLNLNVNMDVLENLLKKDGLVESKTTDAYKMNMEKTYEQTK